MKITGYRIGSRGKTMSIEDREQRPDFRGRTIDNYRKRLRESKVREQHLEAALRKIAEYDVHPDPLGDELVLMEIARAALANPAPSECPMCEGRGQLSGFVPRTVPCPDCDPAPSEEPKRRCGGMKRIFPPGGWGGTERCLGCPDCATEEPKRPVWCHYEGRCGWIEFCDCDGP